MILMLNHVGAAVDDKARIVQIGVSSLEIGQAEIRAVFSTKLEAAVAGLARRRKALNPQKARLPHIMSAASCLPRRGGRARINFLGNPLAKWSLNNATLARL
jgi:hypothetical protein